MLPPAHSLPHWLMQRQVKSEPVGDDTLLLKGPNLPPYEISVRPATDSQGWTAALYALPSSSGNDTGKVLLAESREPVDSPQTAWGTAFELYRQQVIV